jgi:hypothetical protein
VVEQALGFRREGRDHRVGVGRRLGVAHRRRRRVLEVCLLERLEAGGDDRSELAERLGSHAAARAHCQHGERRPVPAERDEQCRPGSERRPGQRRRDDGLRLVPGVLRPGRMLREQRRSVTVPDQPDADRHPAPLTARERAGEPFGQVRRVDGTRSPHGQVGEPDSLRGLPRRWEHAACSCHK